MFASSHDAPHSCQKLCFAGCRGAAAGEGLGNAFLSHIQAVDGIFHVCRGFEVRARVGQNEWVTQLCTAISRNLQQCLGVDLPMMRMVMHQHASSFLKQKLC